MRFSIYCTILMQGCWNPNQIEGASRRPADVEVVRVVDGDTIIVSPAVEMPDGTWIDTFRLLCIDAPESGTECFDAESTAWLESVLLDRSVRLVFDEDAKDIYGRGLAYVIVRGRNIGVRSAELGYSVLIDAPFDDATWCPEVGDAERAAAAAGRGGWGACDGAPWVE